MRSERRSLLHQGARLPLKRTQVSGEAGTVDLSLCRRPAPLCREKQATASSLVTVWCRSCASVSRDDAETSM
jgi:hypothetical protein